MRNLLGSNPWFSYGVFRVSRVLFYSTEALSSSSPPVDSLYDRISRIGNPRVSIVPVLNQWVEQGRDVKQAQLQKIIRQLRKYRRFTHALQISEWISIERNHGLSSGDTAVHLDLISKVHGLEQAEKYFDSIPDSLRGYQIHGALLNCYAEKQSFDKAEVIFKEMRELGFLKNSLSYNVMLSLYSQMSKHEKLASLVQEMEAKGIKCDKFTFNIRLNAYAANSDIEGMEKLLTSMEADPLVDIDWNTYVIIANGYLKAGQFEKALTMLRRSEQLIGGKARRFAYEQLLTLYAVLANKDEVYRIWNLYKNIGRRYNSGYVCVLSSLVKLNDIDGAEKILEEWESGDTRLDFRVPCMLIRAYWKKGLPEKAEAYIKRLIESGKKPDARIWNCMSTGYYMDGQMAKAVETMKKAVLACEQQWKPNRFTLAACLEYLKGEGNVEVADEILTLLREQGFVSTGMYNRLQNYISGENPDSGVLDELKNSDSVEEDDLAINRERHM
ncbi:pentatricopeptide repeat-containing protein At2g20710, mitochondrial [Ziziphus jujuba]|uniref:Pentatricopeptide repeat-containing protein At2g20710, mitochondrial n=2 Tax=Ziziphus jujuba TaxID=326968 RepID=A0A6P3ZM21_ZIZJJ|nr:pentatricopeptide repeat-containing protein At2g20710, mitochondrial [Ziziphus jujuba]KAH7533328.1 hypothetical protein FEM48_Zijuj04G0119200 [Ziziphus jujuba var. spinosa]